MTRKIIYIEVEKNWIVRKKELILEKPVRSAENVNLPKEEAHDHRKATKLVMSFQSSDIKLAGAILLRVLTLKK